MYVETQMKQQYRRNEEKIAAKEKGIPDGKKMEEQRTLRIISNQQKYSMLLLISLAQR